MRLKKYAHPCSQPHLMSKRLLRQSMASPLQTCYVVEQKTLHYDWENQAQGRQLGLDKVVE